MRLPSFFSSKPDPEDTFSAIDLDELTTEGLQNLHELQTSAAYADGELSESEYVDRCEDGLTATSLDSYVKKLSKW